ncbi:MFS transporter [Dankookia rubra]|uniref:MFS transporter n=1 Tax=Dankookia rubra TaxID=1442381 RepID=A0A4R5QJ02_9PROT|nr:MFS transporter [Dankookia rubra]
MLPRYLLLFVLLFLGWGVLSPFLPAVLALQGASASEVGLLLGMGTALRLFAMPVAGAVADRTGAPRQVLALALLGAAVSVLCYGMVGGGAMLLLVGVAHALATAPVGPLPDALAVRAAAGPRRLDYGVVRGAGAAAFIAASTAAGLAVAAAGSPRIVLWLNAGLFVLAAGAALRLPRPAITPVPSPRTASGAGSVRALLRLAEFRRLVLVSGLIQGSHAFYAGFAVLGWQAAGIGPGSIGLLWSLSVAAEVLVFLLLGRRLLGRLGVGGTCALAAAAGLLRWSAMALDAPVALLVPMQLLHGLTFAAQHMAAMAVLARLAPDRLGGTAQALLASLGTGLFTAVLLLASGALYERIGLGGFWAMAALCALAVPLARGLPGREG